MRTIKRNISEERKQQLREQLENCKENHRVQKCSLISSCLPEDSIFFKNVKEWIKDNKEQIAP